MKIKLDKQFQTFLINKVSFNEINVSNLLKWFNINSRQDIGISKYFIIALKFYLTIPVANCSAEQAFLKLTRIKINVGQARNKKL